MKNKFIDSLRGNTIFSALLVVTSLFAMLVPYSFLVGWNIFTLTLLWFVLVPIISVFAARFLIKASKRLTAGLYGCILFYLLMIFLTYNHYQSDYFKVMIISLFTSVLSIWLLNRIFSVFSLKKAVK